MDVEEYRSAVIVGGGIGGLAAAVALHRTGWAVTVYERAGDRTAAGTGLIIWPNAVRALAAIGLGPAVSARAAVQRSTGVRRPDGRWLSRTEGEQVVHRHGQPLLGITRAALVEVLESALPPGSVRSGVTVTDLDPGGPNQRPSVRCGDELVSADLIVGADGVSSVVRRAVWPRQPPPRHRGYLAWRALVRASVPDPGASETWGRGERFGIVPMPDDLVYLYATANTAPDGPNSDNLAELRRRFGHWHEPIAGMLAAVDPASLLRHDVVTVEPALKEFHHGAVALLGDAAHAMEPNLGQGACLAIEDAVVLAHALSDGSPLAAALARYSQARVPRVTRLARQSRLLGRLTQTEIAAVGRARDTVTGLIPDRFALRGFDDAANWFPPALPTPSSASREQR